MKKLDLPVWTAVITPLNREYKVDYGALEKLLLEQAQALNGVVLLGSTAEALNLSLADKKAIVKFATSLKLKTPMILGVGGHQLEECQAWIHYGEEYGFDGYLLVTPLYAKPGPLGQTRWFEALMNTSTKPCMLYNVPGRTAAAMSPQVLQHLKGHTNLWALKEASGSIEKFAQFRETLPTLTIYSGDDALLPFFVPLGCQGVVSVASNAWPKATHIYAQFCLERKFEHVLPLWDKACHALFLSSNPVPVKALMHAQGKIATPYVLPPLWHEDFTQLLTLTDYDRQIHAWLLKESL